MENNIILGLDISTTCTGISIAYVDENRNVKPLVVTHLRPKISKKTDSSEALYLKCNLFIEKLKEILYSNELLVDVDDRKVTKITKVVIEEPLISSNNRATVATLLRYNGMVAYRVYNLLNIVPDFISSYDARMYGVPSLMAVRKYSKSGKIYPLSKIKKAVNSDELVLFGAYPFDCAKKLILWNYVSDLFPDIQWVYNKKGDLSNENFDASDSLICVLGYVNKVKFYGTKPHVTFSSSDENSITYTYDFCGKSFTRRICTVDV